MAKAKKDGGSPRKKPWTGREVLAEIPNLQERIGRFKAIAKKMDQMSIPVIQIDGDAGLARGYQFIDLFLVRAETALAEAAVRGR